MPAGIRCMLMRGGTSKGGYFLASDLPSDLAERDDLLLRVMGSPDPRQIDGLGGAHPLTSKVAIVERSTYQGADVDFLFAQVSVDKPAVDTTPNCGNILAGVGPFAIERGLMAASDPVTRVRVRTINTGTLAELVVSTPGGKVCYEGDEVIDGVPGCAAAMPINFLDAEGSVCGSLLPTGNRVDEFQGIQVTCIDNGMPVVILRAADAGFDGAESCAEVEAAADSLKKIESIRRQAAYKMGMGDVSEAVVPKVALVSRPRNGGTLCVRSLIPWRCHDSIGVFAAVSIATACVLPETPANALAHLPSGKIKRIEMEHPSGSFAVRLEIGGTDANPVVEKAGLVRTARALFDGVVFPRSGRALKKEGWG